MIGLVPPEHAGARKCGDGGVTAHRADGQPPRVGSVDAHLLYTLCSRAEIIKIRLLSSLMVSSGATRLAAAAASANIAGALEPCRECVEACAALPSGLKFGEERA